MTLVFAALIGALTGAGIVWGMLKTGMLAERSGAAVLLIAVASFYPVFAVIAQDPLAIVLHLAIFVAFVILSVRAYRRSLLMVAGGLIAHAIFDVLTGLINAPGPTWWPAFCAAVDIVAGVSILRLIQAKRIAP